MSSSNLKKELSEVRGSCITTLKTPKKEEPGRSNFYFKVNTGQVKPSEYELLPFYPPGATAQVLLATCHINVL